MGGCSISEDGGLRSRSVAAGQCCWTSAAGRPSGWHLAGRADCWMLSVSLAALAPVCVAWSWLLPSVPSHPAAQVSGKCAVLLGHHTRPAASLFPALQASWRTSLWRASLRRRTARGRAKQRPTPVCAATPTMRQTRWHAGPRWRRTARAPRPRGRRHCSAPCEHGGWPAAAATHSAPSLLFYILFAMFLLLALSCLNCFAAHYHVYNCSLLRTLRQGL